ncbi:MAG: DUF2231 domain-containing protein [Phycisphaerae bacterium]|nr:DUF2231 domain-containing protein [Phycisphaerae bacterium]
MPVLALVFALGFSGPLSAQDAPSQPALNRYCPVMTEEEADPNITTVYKGRTIAFCCDNCLAKFKANREQYSDRLASLGTSGEQPPAGGTLEEHAADTHDGYEHGADETSTSVDDGDGQDHETGENRPPLLARVHPVLVHFPVAGIPLALLGLVVAILSRKPAFAAADMPPLLLAALASIAAVITGNIAHDTLRFSSSLHDYVQWHQYAGTTVMILVLLLSVLRVWRWNRLTGRWLWGYGSGLLLASVMVGLTGYLGGSLVFGPDHLAW